MKYPSVPPELAFALAVNVENLRPWEWWACDAEEYGMIIELRAAWFGTRADERRGLDRNEGDPAPFD